ncbi:AAA family ATPase [Bradyrhizobium sp. WYCCWR 13022]|uniref:AAA family ATPase n=1 Tax=unclassified Bradyrhizobium TaxID=2631580 RepID=UPI00263BA739|nr:AAA family ATPase [Bradyrhizobium sp. WYCCWR 13022]MDN4987148.1 AAA family ATPase [Bradyrhizobium sp. WYCCWR 13022]
MDARVSLAFDSGPQLLWEDGEHALHRGQLTYEKGRTRSVLVLRLTAARPRPASFDRLTHEYGLKDHLDGAWAASPLELFRDHDRAVLVLDDPGGKILDRQIGEPMEVLQFLRVALDITTALGQVHLRSLVHKDLKPAHILVDNADGRVRLTGFGLASRLPRERQPLAPPEIIAGTLAYMAPEQTGRMNRSVDSRSDLYALGVIFYQMLTGSLPFTTPDPMELIHCHIARTPVPPHELVPTIPTPVSHIVMKLLAKTADERYQTATGIEHDLRRCLSQWQSKERIDAFSTGDRDTPDRLLIPERLYGRESEITSLLNAYHRVATTGTPELMVIGGYSGIGKSAVVSEMHKALVPSRGLFASGKFDQQKRDAPYATLAQAFQGLIRGFLSKSDAELAGWRRALSEALGAQGQLVIGLVPELKLIIGEQPPTPDLPPQQARQAFQIALRRFVGVFAAPDHPLVLFLDDMQWADAETLDFLEDLMTTSDLHHLLLIGAYRDNEVDPTHPLVSKLQIIRSAGARMSEIALSPLGRHHIEEFIMEALRCTRMRAIPLSQILHEKTGGNPFFVIQFLIALVNEGVVAFDPVVGGWSWDSDRIRSKGYTDNVAELMVARLGQLPAETQTALQQLACLGSTATIAMLSTVLETSEDRVHAAFWEAARYDLIEWDHGSYRFIHDRVQEAAYSLIPQDQRAKFHLRIGRLLASHMSSVEREESVFDVINQLNRGAALIISERELEQVANLNLIAGKRARASTAYFPALKYFIAGASLLPADSWDRRHELAFALEFYRAECEFLVGEMAAAEERLIMLSSRAANSVEQATVASLRVDLYTTLDRSDDAVGVCIGYLRHLGVDWSPHPTQVEVVREYEQVWNQLGDRAIEELIDLPLMSDPESLATLDVLTRVFPSALFTDEHFLSLAICHAVNLSLERGHGDGSCVAYVFFSKIAGPLFSDYNAGFRFGQLGYDLVEKRGLKRFQARTYLWFAQFSSTWTRHVRASRALILQASEAATKAGDLTLALYSCDNLNTNFLAAGDPLAETQRQAEYGIRLAESAKFSHVIDIMRTQLGLMRSLRGLTHRFGCFDDGQMSEIEHEQRFSPNPATKQRQCWYWIRKLQARFFAGDYLSALEAEEKASSLLWTSAAQFEVAEYHYYAALSRAACCNPALSRPDGFSPVSSDLSAETLAVGAPAKDSLNALMTHHRQLEVWAESCPENFENRAALVGAEIARIEGRELDAQRLYERAIRSAKANGFVHNEAVAYELAARFYRARGFDEIARLYLRNARYGYLKWGADGKVRQLDEMFPQLGKEGPALVPTSTMWASLEHLDLATIVKLSQALSGEIVPDKLMDTLMRMAVEHAGAQRGILILSRGSALQIVAEATTRGDALVVRREDQAVVGSVLPESVVYYVAHTRESVILDDASAQNPFSADPFVGQHRTRSILCLPLIKQAMLVGVLYLENNLAPHVFTPARVALLELLASQAAISLENTRLYAELEEREAKIRRLVDANIVGIFIWNSEGEIVEANDAFLQMVGYRREDIGAGLRRTDLTPPEWRDHDERSNLALQASGTVQPFEKEYFRRDGSRTPVLVGAAAFGAERDGGVAFVIDLTDRKQAEAQARENERRHRELQMELEHANRVVTLGYLSGSIAHEVNQPIAAALTNTETALRWLSTDPPNLDKMRAALRRLVDNIHRARDVIGGVRALIKKAPARTDRIDMNDAIREVITLTHGEAIKNGVLVRTRLAEALPDVEGDRVQLQQVVLNLIINAIEAMTDVDENKRELLITTTAADSQGLLVTVTDSGPGLSPAKLERLFEAFYTTKASGLGMGLPICRSIIEAHGGRLWATTNITRGATFQFTLPARMVVSAISG